MIFPGFFIRWLVAIRIVAGLIFVLSAIMKLHAIDTFDLYIFSHNLFSFDFSSVLSRLLIAIELFLGIALIAKVFFRKIWLASMLLLFIFSIYLLILVVLDQTGNCFCFGELLQLSPTESLIKNIVLIGFFYFIRNEQDWNFRYKKLFAGSLFVICLSIPSIITPPDFLMNYESKNRFHEENLQESLNDPEIKHLELSSGKKIVGMFTFRCRFCVLAASKLNIIKQQVGDSETEIIFLFFGDPEDSSSFLKKSDAYDYPMAIIQPDLFFQISKGSLPGIMLLEEGIVIHDFGYRDMDESVIKNFL